MAAEGPDVIGGGADQSQPGSVRHHPEDAIWFFAYEPQGNKTDGRQATTRVAPELAPAILPA